MDRKFVEGVLLRCFIIGFVVLMIWFVFVVLLGPDFISEVHGSIFKQITGRQFQVIHYCGMGLLKLFVSVFFFIPYIAMRWTAKRQNSPD